MARLADPVDAPPAPVPEHTPQDPRFAHRTADGRHPPSPAPPKGAGQPPQAAPTGARPVWQQLARDLDTLLGPQPLAAHAGEAPVRAVLFGRARFDQHGRSLAATHEAVAGGAAGPFFPRLDDNIAALARARGLLERQLQEGHQLGPAAHWLLDNATLVDEQLHLIREAVSPSFYRRLPRLRDEPLAGLPRIYGVAWAWVAHTDSGADEALLTAYLAAYQAVRPLALAELWALPATIRVVLLENLRRLAERTALTELARDAANLWFDQPDGQRQVAELDRMAERLARHGAAEAFVLQLQQREDELDEAEARPLAAWLVLHLPDAAGAQQRQQAQATEDHQSIRNAITTLRTLDRVHWRRVTAATSPVLQTLARAPVFAAERHDTQDQTLRAVQRLARASRRPETEVAEVLLQQLLPHTDASAPMAAPGYWWQGPGRHTLRRALGLSATPRQVVGQALVRGDGWPVAAYLCGLAGISLGLTAWLVWQHTAPQASGWLVLLAAALLAAPVGEATVAVVNRLISESLPPRRLPRLALHDGVPADERVLVVMPCMLTSTAGVKALCAQLEQHHVANRDPHAQFALLSDWADADSAQTEADEALLLAARADLEALNARHPCAPDQPPRFLLLHRDRRWSDTEQRWIGWERKRGKLEQLVALLAHPGESADRSAQADLSAAAGHAGESSPPTQAGSPFLDMGALSRPHPGTRHLLSLDADTDLPPGRLRELMGVALHPLNRPRVDPRQRRVVAGHGILQPRVVTPLPLPEQVSWYHRLFAGQCGIDPYSAATSEVYQDLFGEGTFTGKGLLNVQAMHQVLDARLPEGQVLSHDLLEGALARCAAVSDITVVEDAPVHADVAASRLHRWARGDWQLLPFLLRPRAWPMAAVNRWKMLDNLRRSLVAPLSVALLLLVLATGVLPLGLALGAVLAAFCAGPLLGALAGMAPSRDDISLRLFFGQALADLGRVAGLALWQLLSLLAQARLYTDAVARALWRQVVSRRRLLQWTTAAAAQAAARTDGLGLLRQHWRDTAAAALLGLGAAALAWRGALAMPAATAALLLAWAATPLWVWRVSVPRPVPRRERLAPADRDWLWGVARDTWRFYEHHVGEDDHHLPPDNVQMLPREMVAHRTSPTNIGMYLLSAACAQALGFIGRSALARRLDDTLGTLERLPRWQGHFYNWYDTTRLAVLPPAYVSTVDSGNCCGHLLAVAAACEALAARPMDAARRLQRVAESQRRLKALAPVLHGAPSLRQLARLAEWPWAQLPDAAQRAELAELLQQARLQVDALGLGGEWWPEAPGGPGVDRHGQDQPMARTLHDHVALVAALLDDLEGDPQVRAAHWRLLAERCRRLAEAPDFRPLYDPQRKLLHIGYRVEAQQVDEGHYDLLASEARLTSLLAIAKGDVPPAHWGALGRPLFAWGMEVGLKSWSGSMFEYLMPSLILDEPVGSLLHQATRSAVAAQRDDARRLGTPWGVSESAIAGQDHTLAYQYGPQGVAALALRRTPPEERLVAPYASLMALLVAPRAAVANLRQLQALGARSGYGFIEALDYSPQRQVADSPFVPVATHMAHHQGMALVALADVLADGLPRRWAAADPMLRATLPLLHEPPPRQVPPLRPPPPVPAPRRQRAQRLLADAAPHDEALPSTQLLTNGRLAVVLRSHGTGQTLWNGLALTRARDDLPGEQLGLGIHLRRGPVVTAGEPVTRRVPDGLSAVSSASPWVSVTARQAADPQARYTCRHLADRSVFEAHWPDLSVRTTVWVSPEDDCELREVVLTATGTAPVALTLSSCAEAVLALQRADEAHPAFSNLFVRASWDAEDQALYLLRRPRLPDEPSVLAAHFLACSEGAAAVRRAATSASGPSAGPSAGRMGAGLGASDHSAGHCPEAEPVADRARVLGRLGSPAQWRGTGGQRWLPDDPELPGRALDTGLDPVMAIRVPLVVAPGTERRVVYATAAAASREALQTLVDRYRQPGHAERTSGMSHTMAGIRLRELQFDADDWRALLALNTPVTALTTRELPLPARTSAHAGSAGPGTAGAASATTATTAAEPPRCDRRLLWRHGLSGDRPILLVTITAERGLALVQVLKKALRLWTEAGIGVDLVVVNAEPPSYLSPVQHQLVMLRDRLQQQVASQPAERRGVLHLLSAAALQPDERHTLQVLARLRLLADGRSLAQHLEREADEARAAQLARASALPLPVAPLWPARAPAGAPADAPPQPPAWRFDGAMDDLVFEVSTRQLPARPWVNLLANPHFGCLVSESGAGFTWAHNSRMHQVTGWSNDPLVDPPSEQLLLHDLDSQRVWPLGRVLPSRATRQVRHGLGHTTLEQVVDGVDVRLTWCVDAEQPVKQLQARLRLLGATPRRLRLVAVAEWQLGAQRSERLSLATRSLQIATDAGGAGLPAPRGARVLTATQLDHLGGFGGATAFLSLRCDDGAATAAARGADDSDWTCDRRELRDADGRPVLPRRLGRHQGAGLDACAALGVALDLAPGAQASVTVLLGHAETAAAARTLAAQAWAVPPAERLATQLAQWPQRLGALQVRTPDAAFDALVNHWLPYQSLVCRLWARAGFYQTGGAFGFRDQLQDAMCLVGRDPELLATQIRVHAARQFPEGDVQHWWHMPGGAGVRTHFSDDLLWLPLACALYVERTGDTALLDEPVPFLEGDDVPEGREDLYETPRVSAQQASVFEHAARAIDHSLRVGAHGLPLMGTGDWNDGMNRVGHEGRGESAWLAWFACHVVDALRPLALARGEHARAQAWQQARQGWVQAMEQHGWDGRWYRRAFFDDGSPLGSAGNEECQIDLIAQAWAVLSGAASHDRAREAMASAEARLLDEGQGVLRLLDPPLQQQRPVAGYIQAYPPGVRENSGQYNHAAVWAMMAWAQLGQPHPAWAAFRLMSPAHRWQHPDHGVQGTQAAHVAHAAHAARVAQVAQGAHPRGPQYALEPNVMAGDIYTAEPHVGRGGWSWYTGSAGWLARAAQESLLGVTADAQGLRLAPCLPPHWPQAELQLRHGGRRVQVWLCADEDHFQAAWQRAEAEAEAEAGAGIGQGDALQVGPQASPVATAANASTAGASPVVAQAGDRLPWSRLGDDARVLVRAWLRTQAQASDDGVAPAAGRTTGQTAG